MEPRSNSANQMVSASPEQAGAVIAAETAANTIASPEIQPPSPERAAPMELLPVDHAGGMPLPTAPAPVAIQQASPASTPPAGAPAKAADGDLIEKEWIEKVKQIIASTADDPHAQQREVGRLAADYVFKRTGRKIGEGDG